MFGDSCLSKTTKCSVLQGSLSSLALTLSSQKFSIVPKGYTIDVTEPARTPVLCVVAIAPTSSVDVILGAAFLRNFRTVLDYSAKQITLSVNPVNSSTIETEAWSTATIIAVFAGCAGLLLLVLCLVGCCVSCNRKQVSLSDEIEQFDDLMSNEAQSFIENKGIDEEDVEQNINIEIK